MNFKLALVTGASSGLGLALCERLSNQGIPLLLTGRDPERLAAAAKTFPSVVESIALDLSKDRRPLLELIRKHTPDLVLNNAGCGLYGPALMHPLSDQMDLLEINAAAAIEIALEAARALHSRNRPGVICNISSTAGEIPVPTMALYAAAKACVTSFSQSFDAEMRPFGIRVLVSLPGPIDTGFAAHASNNGFIQNSRFALKKEKAARLIWNQIEKRKGIQVIGWRNQLGAALLKLMPRSASNWLLQRSLNERYTLDM